MDLGVHLHMVTRYDAETKWGKCSNRHLSNHSVNKLQVTDLQWEEAVGK